MPGSAVLAQYLGYITSEHRGQPDFTDTISVSAQPFVDEQNLLVSLITKFDLDTSVGVQEDDTGRWIGVARGPINNLGNLDDDVYRFVLRARIIANHWDSTVAGAVVAISEIFDNVAPGTLIFVEDRCDLSMNIIIAGVLPPLIYQEIVPYALPLKPVGIELRYLRTSVDGDPVFGFDVENQYIAGFDESAWAEAIPGT